MNHCYHVCHGLELLQAFDKCLPRLLLCSLCYIYVCIRAPRFACALVTWVIDWYLYFGDLCLILVMYNFTLILWFTATALHIFHVLYLLLTHILLSWWRALHVPCFACWQRLYAPGSAPAVETASYAEKHKRISPSRPATGPDGKHLMARPALMWSGTAQPEEATWVPFPMGSPPMGGVRVVVCSVSRVVAKGGDLAGPILGCRSWLYVLGTSPL